VRISGVNVGHVITLKLGKDGRTHATLELSSQYAPVRSDMHAIARQKTLLGETYVQLIPQGNGHEGPFLADGGQLPDSQVEPSVTLDGVLSALDAKTRRAFQVWQQSVAEGINGHGEEINADFATLDPFVEHTNRLVGILASQEGAVTAVVHNTGVVFNALASRDHQLEGLIVNSERTFHAAAEESQAWADAFRALPAFEKGSRVALKELDNFANDANPWLDQFRAAEIQLAGLTAQAKTFAPAFDSFLTGVGPLTKAAKAGLPDVSKTLGLTVPLIENFRPVLHNFDPFLQYAGEYVPRCRRSSPTSQLPPGPRHQRQRRDGTTGALPAHYAGARPAGAGGLFQTDRHRPGESVLQAGALGGLGSGLPVFSSSSCANSAPSVSGPPNATVSQPIIEQLIELHVANAPESPNASRPPRACSRVPSLSTGSQASSRTWCTRPPPQGNDERRVRVSLSRAGPHGRPGGWQLVDSLHGRRQASRRHTGTERADHRDP